MKDNDTWCKNLNTLYLTKVALNWSWMREYDQQFIVQIVVISITPIFTLWIIFLRKLLIISYIRMKRMIFTYKIEYILIIRTRRPNFHSQKSMHPYHP